ncbi:MAG: hypothetical protein ACR2PM_10075, partial [Hyphomicrobiales bacterium]
VWAKCPHCADGLHFDTASAPFRVRAMKELSRRELETLSEDVLINFTESDEGVEPSAVVVPAQPPTLTWAGDVSAANAYEWLYGAARHTKQQETAEKIRNLFGRCRCPTCDRSFAVMDAQLW